MTPDKPEMEDRAARLAELETHMTFRVSKLAKLLEISGAKLLEGTGLSLTWYRMLLVLGIFGQITAAEMSRIMVIDRAQISRGAAGLIRAGLIEALPDPHSRRRKQLRLTPAGKAAMDGAKARFDAREARLDAAMGDPALNGALDAMSALLADDLALPDARPASMHE